MKLSSIFGKKIISKAGKSGYVISVYADGGKICGLVCADENENEFFVGADSIKSVKTNIAYKGGTTEKINGSPVTLGKPVFDGEGEYYGDLTDFTVENNELVCAHVGIKKFSCGDIAVGDAVIIKNSAQILKSDVKKGNRVIIKRGTPLTPEILDKARKKGEYVQTKLKTI